MEQLYGLSKTRNVEIAYRWGMMVCKSKWRDGLPMVKSFLATHGRGAYVKPLYQALFAFDAEVARATFECNRGFYMSVITRQLAAVVGKRAVEKPTNQVDGTAAKRARTEHS